MKKFAIATAAAAMLSTAAFAQLQFETSAGYSALDGDGATLGAVTVRGTAFFNAYFGAEVEGSFGVTSEEVNGVDLELGNFAAAYAVGRLPTESNFEFLFRVGYGAGEIDGGIDGFGSTSVDIDGVLAGLGGQYFITPNFALRGDYTRLEVSDEDLDGGLDIYTFGVVYRFGG
ncbi:MAG: outer membrane beta-barrel protein [Pseudomonadota bacterium]